MHNFLVDISHILLVGVGQGLSMRSYQKFLSILQSSVRIHAAKVADHKFQRDFWRLYDDLFWNRKRWRIVYRSESGNN